MVSNKANILNIFLLFQAENATFSKYITLFQFFSGFPAAR